MMVRNLLVALGCALLVACAGGDDSNSQELVMDNPTDRKISFSIDDQEYTLSAGKDKTIRLELGDHRFVSAADTLTFVAEANKGGLVLNPTRSSYVVYRQVYARSGGELSATDYNATVREYDIDGERVIVPFVATRSLLIKQQDHDWQLGLDDKVAKKDMKPLAELADDEMPKAKIYRGEQFLDYLGRENLSAGFTFMGVNTNLETENEDS